MIGLDCLESIPFAGAADTEDHATMEEVTGIVFFCFERITKQYDSILEESFFFI